MFVNGASFMSLLQAVTVQCHLPYASLITEITEDGSILCRVEIELPHIELIAPRQQHFFWATPLFNTASAYEQASLQAVSFLQNNCGFVVTNYSFNGLVLYRKISEVSLSFANRTLNLAFSITVPDQKKFQTTKHVTAQPSPYLQTITVCNAIFHLYLF